MAAEKEEQRLKQQEPEAAKSVLISSSHPPAGNQITITVPYCTHCKKNYHSVDDCWVLHPDLKKANDKKRRGTQSNGKGKRPRLSPSDAEDDTYNFGGISVHLMAAKPLSHLGNLWALDTGCTQHVTHWREDFVTFKPYTGGPIAGIGGTKIQPSGQGTVELACNVRGRRVIMLLSDTLYCPTIGVNLISVSQLLPERDVNITFHREHAKIHAPGRTFIAAQHGGLYLLNMWSASKPLGSHAYPSYGMQDHGMSLWHERMGHLGEQNLQRLATMSTGMERRPDFCLCKPCVYGRMRESPHKTPSKRGEYPMEYIHTDIAGPLPVTGYDGSRYWVTFLDDYTQLSEAIPIANKSDMFPEFQKFLTKHERPERRYHRVRLDDSGENRTQEFRDWCLDRGITVEATCTEQHQQNGAAKSLNRVLMDKLHPTMLAANLDKKWWPEILKTVNYLRDLSPSSVTGKTPYEGWYGDKPSLTFALSDAPVSPRRRKRAEASLSTPKPFAVSY